MNECLYLLQNANVVTLTTLWQLFSKKLSICLDQGKMTSVRSCRNKRLYCNQIDVVDFILAFLAFLAFRVLASTTSRESGNLTQREMQKRSETDAEAEEAELR